MYEPFAGSSTTVIACELSGRIALAIELNPAYVDVGVLRWQEFTGQEATHADTGKTFAAMKAERVTGPAEQPASACVEPKAESLQQATAKPSGGKRQAPSKVKR